MDLRDYLRAIRKRWWLVVGAMVIAVGVAVAVTLVTPPRYAASVTFFVSTRGTAVSDAYQGGLFSQQRVKSYVDVMTSNRLAQAILAKQPVDLSAEEVQAEITAQVVPDTVLLQATVTDGNRARALQLAQSLASEFPVLINTLETPPGSKVATVGVKVIAEPRLADAPVSPQPTRNVGLAVALGLIIGAGAAALREALDSSIRSGDGLATATGAPVLSVIPQDAKSEKTALIVEGSAQSSKAEAVRQLRTNLQFVNVDHPMRSLVVSSAVPGEGKSTTVCNLGIAFAEAGKRVILIDADLRRPKLAEYLGLEGAVGLTNVLAGQVELRDAAQPWGDSGMWVLPSGSVPPNPSELLASGNMADLLGALSSGFDMVIIDTPPLLPVTDAAVMATIADGCLLVSRYAKTSASQAAAAAAALASVGAKLHGCVLNMAPRKGNGDYAYYSYVSSDQPKSDEQAKQFAQVPRQDNTPSARPSRSSRRGAAARTAMGQVPVAAIDAPTTEIVLPPSAYRATSAVYDGTAYPTNVRAPR